MDARDTIKTNFRNASIKNNHSLGVSPPETNKQPRQSPSEENPGS